MDIPQYIRDTNRGFNPVFVEDIFEPKTQEQLLADWSATINPDIDYAVRDSLLEGMRRKSVRPQVWLRERDAGTGIYPDIEDPDFASLLYKKTEFASLASVLAPEETCIQSRSYFETTPVQRLVARFLHPSTPYNGILLNHGVGVGKTCSAITVAETFLESMPTHTVFIIAPQAIASGFRKTIFDANRLVAAEKEHTRLTGERWKSTQCTGMNYLRLTGTAAEESLETITKEVDKVIRRRYAIMGYLAFANWVKRKLAAAVPPTVTGAAREREENAVLLHIFSDHLIIIDEAHNLRDTESASEDNDEVDESLVNDSAAGKALTPIIKRIVAIAEGLRLMLMTATPMYNTAPEITFLLDLLLLNDTKDPKRLLGNSVFKRDGSLILEKQTDLVKVIKRYVSYMRGENPNTFPLRLTPPESNIVDFVQDYPTTSISRAEGTVSITDLQKNIMKALPLVITPVSPDTIVGSMLQTKLTANAMTAAEREEEGEGVSNFVLDEIMQIGNITYPNRTWGKVGLSTYFKANTITIKGTKCLQYTWKEGTLEDGSIAPAFDTVFGSGLVNHAPKIAKIVDLILKGKGMSFVYSRYVKAGAIPIAIALEANGYCRCLADGTPAPLLKRTGVTYKGYYILLTSDQEASPNFKGLLDYATTFKTAEEADGRKVKAIIGSTVASEGLDLKCIRQLHLLDGWYHLNRIEQITGRGVRFCSHTLLPIEQRNCLVYLHAVSIPTFETSDLYAYRLAVRKAIPIGIVSRLMKINAWDCMLNSDAIILKELPSRYIVDSHGLVTEEYELKDKPYTSFCDYEKKCEYICGSKPVPLAEIGSNTSTYSEFDFRRMFLEKQALLAGIFSTEVAEPLDKIKTIVYGDIPWSIGAIGLREALGTIRIRREDGLYGTLVLQNDYIVFQPDSVTDTAVPIALRYGRAYGRLPRTIVPVRGTVLSYAAPAAADKLEEMPEKATLAQEVVPKKELVKRAMDSLALWRASLDEIVTKPAGPINIPIGFKEETFNGLRWVYHHFADLEETKPIAIKWWMDNIWTTEERAAVLSEFVSRTDELADEDAKIADLFRPVELFQGAIKGFFEYKDGKVKPNCLIEGESTPTACPTSFLSTIENLIGKPVDRRADTDEVFGMIVNKSGNAIFKTVDKTAGKVLKLEGAECANQSNLKNHEARIMNVHKKLKEAFPAEEPIIKLLLAEDVAGVIEDNKVRQGIQDALKKLYNPKLKATDPSLRITHVTHLSLKQICPYMEFLLRWMDMRRVGGKRWFLSLIDAVRAGAKMGE
jgi:hypothetical protein